MDALTRKRDRVAAALRTGGAAVLQPEGTFYLWSRWPAGDPDAHWNRLADRGVFVMPGSIMGVPGWFRMCLTASEEMVERAVPVLESIS
jgi:aspartate aminotransferase